MSKKPQKARKPAPKSPGNSSKPAAADPRSLRRTAAGFGAVAAVAGALWFGIFGPLFRAKPDGEAPDPGPVGQAGAVEGFRPELQAAATGGEHAVPDLAPDAPTPGTNRAVEAFRPDPTAPVPLEERDALRPATGPAPTLSEDRGAMRSQTAPANVAES